MRKVKLKMFMCVLSCFICVQLFTTLCTIAHQASLYMGFLSKNTGVGSHSLLQGILPSPGLNPHLIMCLHWQVGCLSLFITSATREA